MRYSIYTLLTILLACSCQEDKLINDDLIDEWKYERELSSMFSNLLDRDIEGTIILNSEGTGSWNGDMALVDPVPLTYNYDLSWKFDETNQQIEIIKTPSLSALDSIRIYEVERKSADRISLIYENRIPSSLEPLNVMDEFENIHLTRK